MIPTTLFVLPKQEGKIKTALKKKRGCQIKTRKSNQSQCAGMLRGEMLLTPSQWRKYNKARDGQVVSLPFKHEHLMQNMKHKGGFLPLLAAALVPLISGVAGGLIEKGIAGSGIHPPKLIWCKRLSGHEPTAFQIDPAPHGAGLYLSLHGMGNVLILNLEPVYIFLLIHIKWDQVYYQKYPMNFIFLN